MILLIFVFSFSFYQMNCKLYGWVAGSWQERGRGLLRLNDWGTRNELHSRLVIRTQGTLTVMLNTQVRFSCNLIITFSVWID